MASEETTNKTSAKEDAYKLQKLRLEVRDLKSYKVWSGRHWFEKIVPSYLPGLIAMVAFITALATNLFEVKSERLQLRKDKLEFEVEVFERDRGKIIHEKDSLKALTIVYKQQLDSATAKLVDLVQTAERESGKLSLTNDTRKLYRNSIRTLKSAILKADNIHITVDDTTRIDAVFDKTFDPTFN